MYSVALFIHIGSMMIGFAALPVAGAVLRLLIWRAPTPEGAQMIVRAFQPTFVVGGVAVGVGVVAGLYLAQFVGFTDRWLTMTYGLMLLAAGIGILIDDRWARRLRDSNRSAFDTISNQFLPRAAAIVGPVCWLAILWLMIDKPA